MVRDLDRLGFRGGWATDGAAGGRVSNRPSGSFRRALLPQRKNRDQKIGVRKIGVQEAFSGGFRYSPMTSAALAANSGSVLSRSLCNSVSGYRDDVVAAAKEEALLDQVPHCDGANSSQENGCAH